MRPTFSMAMRQKAGMATGMARKILDEAVCMTADLAHLTDLPIGSFVSGSHSSMPFSISTYLINQLFAKPPVMQATVLVSAFNPTRRAPVALAEAPELTWRIMRAIPTEAPTAIT